jgi:hypothetical protein
LGLDLSAGRYKGGSVSAAGGISGSEQNSLRAFNFLRFDGTNANSLAYLPLRKVCL